MEGKEVLVSHAAPPRVSRDWQEEEAEKELVVALLCAALFPQVAYLSAPHTKKGPCNADMVSPLSLLCHAGAGRLSWSGCTRVKHVMGPLASPLSLSLMSTISCPLPLLSIASVPRLCAGASARA